MPSNDPEYQKRYIKQHYLDNKEYYKAKAKIRSATIRVANKAFVDRFKVYKGCTDCGYDKHPEALHFDHVRGVKLYDVAYLVKSGAGRTKIKEEIRKCDVRCANCHAIVTASRR